jgi:hypothetical protein
MTRCYEHASAVLTSNKGFEEWGEVFGDNVMAAALIDRLVHHCHIVTIRGNSYRMRQHTDLWELCTPRRIPNRVRAGVGAPVRRPRRTEARPLAELSDFEPAELSGSGPALTPTAPARRSVPCADHPWRRVREDRRHGHMLARSGTAVTGLSKMTVPRKYSRTSSARISKGHV